MKLRAIRNAVAEVLETNALSTHHPFIAELLAGVGRWPTLSYEWEACGSVLMHPANACMSLAGAQQRSDASKLPIIANQSFVIVGISAKKNTI